MFEKIKTRECPHCHSNDIRSDTKSNQHCSGNWNELREFKCGTTIRYSPNFDQIETSPIHSCMRSPESAIFHDKRVVAKVKMAEFLEGLDVDRTFKESAAQFFKSYVHS